MNSCPCGSGTAFSACCEPIINGARTAETAEQLMRARYTAYVTAAMDFLFSSTHPGHRKDYDHTGTKAWAENSEWLGLEIIGTTRGGPDDAEGEVEFIARSKKKEPPAAIMSALNSSARKGSGISRTADWRNRDLLPSPKSGAMTPAVAAAA